MHQCVKILVWNRNSNVEVKKLLYSCETEINYPRLFTEGIVFLGAHFLEQKERNSLRVICQVVCLHKLAICQWLRHLMGICQLDTGCG